MILVLGLLRVPSAKMMNHADGTYTKAAHLLQNDLGPDISTGLLALGKKSFGFSKWIFHSTCHCANENLKTSDTFQFVGL